MKRTLSAVLAGGDMRQIYLGRLLREDGFRTAAVALERHGEELESQGMEAFRAADVIILPMPVMGERGRLNAPLANAPYKMTEVLDAIPAGKTVFGGAVPKAVHEMAQRRGITVTDYLERGELAVLNAIPTAEGAIQIAMEELPVTLHGTKTLVIGNGRIGKALSHRLHALGAEVTVSARRYDDFARIRDGGMKWADTRALAPVVGEFALIFNTVPHPVVTRAVLAKCRPDVVLIDLASRPGGTDFAAAGELVRRAIHALSLPGKVAPVTAASYIRDTITHILQEEGKL